MSTMANPSWTADTDPAGDHAAAAAVEYGVGLVRLLRGFTRRVFGLGRTAKVVATRLTDEGEDTTSPRCRIDISGVVALLRRALHMADALRARLPIPAALAKRRPPSAPGPGRGAEKVGAEKVGAEKVGAKKIRAGEPDLTDPLFLISWRRTSASATSVFRDAIAHMSDRDVVEQVLSDLMLAAKILGDHEERALVLALAYRAALFMVSEDEVDAARSGAPASDDAPSDDAPSDDGALDDRVPDDGALSGTTNGRGNPAMAGARPSPHAVGRAPPS